LAVGQNAVAPRGGDKQFYMKETLVNIGEYGLFGSRFLSLVQLDRNLKDGIYSKEFVIEKIKNTIKHEFNDRSLIVVSKDLSKSMKSKDLAALENKAFENLKDCNDYRTMIQYLKNLTN